MTNESVTLDEEKIMADALYDGIWVLTTNMKLTAREVALRDKELWMVEQTFREMKSVLATRPIYHNRECIWCSWCSW
jgi:IS4 transposase